MSRRTPRAAGRAVGWAAGAVAVFALVGVAAGLLWRSRVHAPPGVVVDHHWYPQPWDSGQQADFAATGWYVVIALLAGLVLGLLAARLSRAPEVVTLGAVVVGSALAGWLMLRVGLHGVPPDPRLAAAHAADGTKLSGTVSRPRPAALVALPLGAIGALCAVFLLAPGRAAAPREEPREARVSEVTPG